MKIAIVGGGIGGLATAVGLHKIGINAHVYEQAHSFKPLGAGIGIGSNVMIALNKLGVGKDVLKSGMSLKEQRFLNDNFQVMNTIDFTLLKERFGEENITIQRADLHQALYEAVDPTYFHFNKGVTMLHSALQMVQKKKLITLLLPMGFTQFLDKHYYPPVCQDMLDILVGAELRKTKMMSLYTFHLRLGRQKGGLVGHLFITE